MDKSFNELIGKESEAVQNVPFRQAIGSLMYLMVGTRPDIAFAIGKLSQHSENPCSHHWTVVKRVLSYINGTREFGILYEGSKSLPIMGFSDAD